MGRVSLGMMSLATSAELVLFVLVFFSYFDVTACAVFSRRPGHHVEQVCCAMRSLATSAELDFRYAILVMRSLATSAELDFRYAILVKDKARLQDWMGTLFTL